MNPTHDARSPRFSVRGDTHGLHRRFVRLDFCDDRILVYDREGGELLHRSEYADVRKCRYDRPRVGGGAGGGVMAVGAPAMMTPAIVAVSLLWSVDDPAGRRHRGLGGRREREETFFIPQSTPDLPEEKVESLFWWIRDRVIASEAGKLKWNTARVFTVVGQSKDAREAG